MLRMVPRTVACLVLGVLASSEALLVGHHPMVVKTSRVGMKPRMAPLETADNVFTSRAVRLANHASALTSLVAVDLPAHLEPWRAGGFKAWDRPA